MRIVSRFLRQIQIGFSIYSKFSMRYPTSIVCTSPVHFLTFALLGVETPLRFFQTVKNSGTQRRRFRHTLLCICSAHVVKKFGPRSRKFRSPGHVKWPHLIKVGMFVKATPTERLPWNFQRLLQVTVSIKCISQNFDVGDLRSGQFCDLYL